MGCRLSVTQRRSRNGANKRQLDTLRSLGLRRMATPSRSRTRQQTRGMLHAVRHLVEVEEGKMSPRDGPKPRADRGAHRAARALGLHSLAPGSRRPRKRVGRGEGSGTGKTSGRGQKGSGARSGAKRRARFEGGQMPIHMRMRKLRGPHMKKSMPFEPFRTHTQPVNISDLETRFEAGAEVTLEPLQASGPRHAQGRPREDSRRRRAHQGAHRPRSRVQRERARAHRGRRRHLRGDRACSRSAPAGNRRHPGA